MLTVDGGNPAQGVVHGNLCKLELFLGNSNSLVR